MHQRSTSNLARLPFTFSDTSLSKTVSQPNPKSNSARNLLPPLRFPPPVIKNFSEEFSLSANRAPSSISRIPTRPQETSSRISTFRSINNVHSLARSTSSISSHDLIDENNLTKKPIDALLKELETFDYDGECKAAQLIANMEKRRLKKVEAQKKILVLFEDMLCLYKIQFDIVSGVVSDSFMDVDGVKDKHDLVKVVKHIAPLICKFPYSFFRKLKIAHFSFCDAVYIHKTGVDNHGINRAHIKALFPIKELDSEEKITDYFYQFIYSNLRTQINSFDKRLISVIKSQAKISVMNGRLTSQSFMFMKKTINVSEEWIILKDLINEPREQLFNEDEKVRAKALIIRIFLEELDPAGINNKWWDKLGCPVQPDYDIVYTQVSSMSSVTMSLQKL